MLTLDFTNILSGKIGSVNGIESRFFNSFLKEKNQLVKKIFSMKETPGYGFIRLPEDMDLAKEIIKFTDSQKKNKWENIVVLGIGGSALGGIAVRDAILGPYHYLGKSPRLFFMDNIDPSNTALLLSSIKIEKTLFIVISKSGETVEPMALYSIVRKELDKKKLSLSKHMVFITDPKKGILRPIGNKEKIAMFPVPPDVGGRFSVLSAVGLLPAALAGIDIKALMSGAKKMAELIKKTEYKENPALTLAALQYLMDRKKKKIMTVMMPYSDRLLKVGDWYRQLLAESIGKNEKTGPTPVLALGTTDQHSQLQLYNQGVNNKWFIFINVKKHSPDPVLSNCLPEEMGFLNGKNMSEIFNAAYVGTSEALAKNKRPNVTIDVEKIDEASVGGLFMLFEFQVALLGLLYNVNAFDQPGVEESKIITKKILSGKI